MPARPVTLRGVAWQPGSGTPATPIYFNEMRFDPGNTIVSLFDVGQIEVLRGPQGTSRGAPSISGAVTITTKKPDPKNSAVLCGASMALPAIGTFRPGSMCRSSRMCWLFALPPISRTAKAAAIHSVNSTVKPKLDDRSFRATVLLKPTDTLSLQAMYQRRKTDKLRLHQVLVPAAPEPRHRPWPRLGGLFAAIPANFNGPALTVGDRARLKICGNITRKKSTC